MTCSILGSALRDPTVTSLHGRTRQKPKCSQPLENCSKTYKVLLPLVSLLCLLQHFLCLLELGVHQLLLQVLVFEHLIDVLPRKHHQSSTCSGSNPKGRSQSPKAHSPLQQQSLLQKHAPLGRMDAPEEPYSRSPALTHLLPQLVLLNELLEPLCQLHVLLAQLGVPLVVLLHLELDVVQRHLEVGCHLLPLLFFLPCTLDTLLLHEEGRDSRDTSASVLGR